MDFWEMTPDEFAALWEVHVPEPRVGNLRLSEFNELKDMLHNG